MAVLNIVGAPPPVVKKEDFEVWPENVDAVESFLRCATQWRVTGSGPVGLDYSVLFSIFDLYDIKDRKGTFEGVQVMETTTLNLMLNKG